ncbi:hypothetical protein Cni_G00496 [Canna indica]|uniref:LOB domain-containing protein n=1 Tax=Canna indica TaxID=4628 RepID=A0AAQ3JMM9_9LILI|nr:hypothetical protein Cni_G00496 [Canna indica]
MPMSTQHEKMTTTKSGGGGGTHNKACAACKFQRRRCADNCPLAAFFPADQTKQFENCHRLFGVSNITKTLRALDPPLKAEAMSAMKYEAEARDRDPVYGCVGYIIFLQQQVQEAERELKAIRDQLEVLRRHKENLRRQQQQQHMQLPSSSSSSSTGASAHVIESDTSYMFDKMSIVDKEQYWAHHSHITAGDSIVPVASAGMQVPFAEVQHEYDEMLPLFYNLEETYESSLEDTLQSDINQVPQNELRKVAACHALSGGAKKEDEFSSL